MISNIYKVFFLALLFSAWKIFSRRYLHPLSRYPGPFLWSVSRASYATAYAQGKLHKRIQCLHDQYGDVVRVAPDELSYRTEEAWKDIHGPLRNFPKDMRFYHASKSKAPSVAVAPDSIHGRQKRAILRAFSVSALQSHERLLRPFVDTLVRMLHPTDGKKENVVVMTEWYNYVIFDFMAFELFGESLHCLEKGTSHTWVDMLYGSIKGWAFLSQSKYFPSLSWVIKAALFLFRRDLLQHRSTKFTSVASKVSAESVSESGDPGFGTYMRAADMSYLHCVLQESLRMYPPVPLGMPRVVPNGGAVVSGQFVPENTSVAVASWATYQSSSNFKDPQLFLPERWSDTDAGGDDVKGALQAFSMGPRGCPGRSLAFGEASLILARLIWAFDLELSPQCSNWADQRAYIIWDKGPLLVKLAPRS
ncbi:cytochrome P450 monooxygenase [Penicillium frequentans]|uniref:Cytochrome P450 monooxygenase n=1 Tax=Penicillium frequentans TaxID=3151616 RepID=A0AAD6CWS2_9EURO|nr:cytochrome P450 monooxygenase [Penicillium glabrum]